MWARSRFAFYDPLELDKYLRANDGGSISTTCYAQLLPTQIPKPQKDSQLKQLIALLGSAGVKTARKNVDEIDLRRTKNFFFSKFNSLLCSHFPPFSLSLSFSPSLSFYFFLSLSLCLSLFLVISLSLYSLFYTHTHTCSLFIISLSD